MEKPDKHREILQAALELLVEQGFHGAPMAQIASRAGVATGTVYCYFESRDVLIRELYRDIEGRINALLDEGVTCGRTVRSRFNHMCTVLIEYFIAHPHEFRYVEQFHHSPYGVEHRRDKFFGETGQTQLCHALFEQGVAEGVLKELPLIVFYALTFGPIVLLVRDHILGFIDLDPSLVERVVAACWESVKR